jgi:hypothetical protein
LTNATSALDCCNTLSYLKKFTDFSFLLKRLLLTEWSAMNYPIPASLQEIVALRQRPVDEELVASAIAGVIRVARSQGQSLEELTAEVLADDAILDRQARRWLSDIVAQAWQSFPLTPDS